MSVISNNVLAGAAGQTGGAGAGYRIERSLRFNSGDSAYLDRTFAAGNRSAWTWSAWFKFSNEGTQYLLTTTASGLNDAMYLYTSSGQLVYWDRYQNTRGVVLQTNRVFRDTSAWYHIVLVADYANATSTDRARLYINGVRETSFFTSNYPNTTEQSYVNAAVAHYIGAASIYLNGYLAENYFIDGQALAATDFGEFDDNNVWQPKAYSGTYGTNGYHLDFSNNSSTSALGTDSSGNSNNWTVNNFSVASGVDNDSLIDTPTNYEASSGNNVGNYATLNPLVSSDAAITIDNGNLDFASTSNYRSTFSSLGMTSGKWYFEALVTALGSDAIIGIFNEEVNSATWPGNTANSWGYEGVLGNTYTNNTAVNTNYDTYGANDIISCAFDADNGKLYFAKNGTWQNSGDPANGTNPAFSSSSLFNGPFFFSVAAGNTGTWSVNFGQRPFTYTPPTGFKSLCTTNLPDPTIEDGSTVMDVSIWTGNGTSQTIKRTDGTSLGFSPDFVWIKQRSGTRYHMLFDTVRGATNALHTNATDVEYTNVNTLTTFNSDGFDISSSTLVNENNNNYVGWSWDAGADSSKTFTVKVVNDSGNKFRFDDFGTSAVTLDLEEGSTYVFDQSDSSNATHPLRFSTTSDGTHGSGTEYTTGVTTTGTPGNAGAKTTITVASGAPTLYYYCSSHSGMGGQANTNSTAGASNFDGSIQSTVRANPSAGFSIVSFTGTETAGDTVGHGLNAAPGFIILKQTDNATQWYVYHQSGGANNYFRLNQTSALTAGVGAWNNTAPTSSVFSLGIGTETNGLNDDHIVYCFAPVEGYSAFGTYTGNGSTTDEEPFVYTGFLPRWLLIKAQTSSTTTDWWFLWDTERESYNVNDTVLYPNDPLQEQSTTDREIDMLANGFRLRGGQYAGLNENGTTYYYMAFAEHPFKTARAR